MSIPAREARGAYARIVWQLEQKNEQKKTVRKRPRKSDENCGDARSAKVVIGRQYVYKLDRRNAERAALAAQKQSGVRNVATLFGTRQFEEGTMLRFWRYEGDLMDLLRRSGGLPWTQYRCLLEQLTTTVSDMHGAGMFHRDIKPENIVYVRKQHDPDGPLTFVLTDFEYTTTRPCCHHKVGTAAYIAPETMDAGLLDTQENEQPEFNLSPMDVWSMGCVLGVAYCGVLLWRSPTQTITTLHVSQPTAGTSSTRAWHSRAPPSAETCRGSECTRCS